MILYPLQSLGDIQILKYKRSCAISPPLENGVCQSGENAQFQYKECATTCTEFGCNNDNSAEELFVKYDEDGKPAKLNCLSRACEGCSDVITSCHPYQNTACFTSSAILEGEEKATNHKSFMSERLTFLQIISALKLYFKFLAFCDMFERVLRQWLFSI